MQNSSITSDIAKFGVCATAIRSLALLHFFKCCPMKMPFSSLSRETRIGLVVLLVLLLLFAAIKLWLFPLLTGGTHPAAAGDRPDDAALREVRDFEQRRRADSLRYVQARQAQWDEWQREKAERQRAREQREAEYQANRARWDAEKAERAARRAEREARYDSLRRLRPQKLAQGAHLDANSADTADFQRIPGVGTAYARAIVGYRERLGGFIDARQLTEINGLPYDAANWVRIAPHFQPQRLNLNRATFKALVRHPYLNYEQVKFIVNRRNKIGPLRGWDDLRGCPLFTERDHDRLTPYVSF